MNKTCKDPCPYRDYILLGKNLKNKIVYHKFLTYLRYHKHSNIMMPIYGEAKLIRLLRKKKKDKKNVKGLEQKSDTVKW